VLIGKFMSYFRAPHTFTKEDLAVSLIIARQLAFSIQRSRTDQQLREHEAQLEQFYPHLVGFSLFRSP
jgi:GAF domain-containing protein